MYKDGIKTCWIKFIIYTIVFFSLGKRFVLLVFWVIRECCFLTVIRKRTVLWVLASQKHCLSALSWLSVAKPVAPCIVFKDRPLNTKCVRER